MTRPRAILLGAVAAAIGLGSCDREPPAREPNATAAAAATIDEHTGLVMAGDWQLVATYCISCHSARQFLHQRGTTRTWQAAIDWMQATQGLMTFPDGVEDRIVAYLATHYGPGPHDRRAPLPHELMPPNPYAPPIQPTARTRAGETR